MKSIFFLYILNLNSDLTRVVSRIHVVHTLNLINNTGVKIINVIIIYVVMYYTEIRMNR